MGTSKLEIELPSETGERTLAKRGTADLAIWTAVAATPLLALLLTPRDAWPALQMYVPLHTVMEVFAVVVALMIFALGWHSIGRRMSRSMVLLSSGFLAVGLLDLGHLLSFPGMPDFITPSSVEKGIEFWLMSRVLCVSVLLAAAISNWSTPATDAFRSLSVSAALIIAAVGYSLVLSDSVTLPATYTEGVGLTPLKIAFEYVIIGICLLTVVVLIRNGLGSLSVKRRQFAAAAATMALSGFCFTLYFSAYDAANVLGHVYKVAAYALLYRAIFIEGVRSPYEQLYESKRRLVQSEQKFRAFLEFAPDAILLVNERNQIVNFNAQAQAMFGLKSEAGAAVVVNTVLPTWDACSAGEVVCRRLDGQEFPAELSRGQISAFEGELTTLIVRDLTARKALERTVADQLSHDGITGLPNRVLFQERLQKCLIEARTSGARLAVYIVDIDHFKKVNDTLSPSAGDSVLYRCAVRLARQLGPHDMLAKYGSDQFIVLQVGVTNEVEVHGFAQRLLECIREPIPVDGHELRLTASIGVVDSRPYGETPESMLRAAHLALSRSKEMSRDSYRIHSVDMDVEQKHRVELESGLYAAIENGELLLHYQPRVCFRTGKVLGVEALVRWRHPKIGMVPPGEFIPVAEDMGLIGQIGAWVLREACMQARRWQEAGLAPMRIAVNISAIQLYDPQFAAQVRQILDETGMRPELLELEITESTVMEEATAAINALRVLKQLGVVLSVDDFGTGYSSLNYLKLFPVDVLKIDRSFVHNATEDVNDATIIRAIIALAHSLCLEVVAEGIETAAQAVLLKRAECDELQGFFFSRPIGPEALTSLVQAHDQKRRRAWVERLS